MIGGLFATGEIVGAALGGTPPSTDRETDPDSGGCPAATHGGGAFVNPDPADPVLNRGSTVADLVFFFLFCFCCTLKNGQRG